MTEFWDEWWHGLQTPASHWYRPRLWFMRRAYMAGLQDAARIIEGLTYVDPLSTCVGQDKLKVDRVHVLQAIHRYYLTQGDR